MTREEGKSCLDIEAGNSSFTANESDVSLSDSETQSWHSQYDYDDNEVSGVEEPRSDSSCISDCSYEVDLEKCERVCRICHLSLVSPDLFVLGCLCKDDLGAAHKQCAYAWFKIKGNKTCEICGSTAKNVLSPVETEVIEYSNESNRTTLTFAPPIGTRSFWHGHGFLNFVLACIVFALVISWLLHYKSTV